MKVCWWFRCRLLLPSTHENKLFAGSGERQRTAAVESPFVEAGEEEATWKDMWLRAFSNKIAATVCVTSLSLDFHSVSARNGFVYCWLVTLQGLKMTLCDPSATDLGPRSTSVLLCCQQFAEESRNICRARILLSCFLSSLLKVCCQSRSFNEGHYPQCRHEGVGAIFAWPEGLRHLLFHDLPG